MAPIFEFTFTIKTRDTGRSGNHGEGQEFEGQGTEHPKGSHPRRADRSNTQEAGIYPGGTGVEERRLQDADQPD